MKSGHIDLTKQEEMGIFLKHETKWLTLVASVTSLENDPIGKFFSNDLLLAIFIYVDNTRKSLYLLTFYFIRRVRRRMSGCWCECPAINFRFLFLWKHSNSGSFLQPSRYRPSLNWPLSCVLWSAII